MSERVLVVEDDPRLAEMLSEYLGQAGFRVAVASLGATALRQLEESQYDAVVLDLMLPDMDGLDVCRQLRTKADTPVLMLTARGDAIDRIDVHMSRIRAAIEDDPRKPRRVITVRGAGYVFAKAQD
jgi:DNA-binding response OmpR family regulator